jgi:hypothetical protein
MCSNNQHSVGVLFFLLTYLSLFILMIKIRLFLDIYFAAKQVFWSKMAVDHKINEQKCIAAAGNRTHNSQSPHLPSGHRLRNYATNAVVHHRLSAHTEKKCMKNVWKTL